VRIDIDNEAVNTVTSSARAHRLQRESYFLVMNIWGVILASGLDSIGCAVTNIFEREESTDGYCQ
jgi:hypothetical protein